MSARPAIQQGLREHVSAGRAELSAESSAVVRGAQKPVCPSCGVAAQNAALETSHGSQLFPCDGCGLHFWYLVRLPDASWYEAAYQGRDKTAMPLERGHRYFLKDPKAPKRGRLLDLGCGVGNFMAAARDAGFDVTGIEFDQAAVRFAKRHYALEKVFSMRPEEFLEARPEERFDIVTFFEVLEHQADPRAFLEAAKLLLAPGGYIALSVPNRRRWQKGTDPLDYPPNHLTRWSPGALETFLERNGFEVLSIREQPLGLARAAQVLSMGLRTGLMSRVAGEGSSTLADLGQLGAQEVQMTVAQMARQTRMRVASRLAGFKNFALVPAAAPLLPFLWLRGYKGLYLYALARLRPQEGTA